MTMNIEQERLDFEATNAELYAEHSFDRFDVLHSDTYHDRYVQLGWTIWLAAKRAAMGSAEPVKMSKAVREFLQEAINDATQGEDADQDHMFAQEVGRLLNPIYTAPPAPVSSEPVQKELESMTRMFNAACVDLGLINEALGLDPDDGGADPILSAIEELRNSPPSTDVKDSDFISENDFSLLFDFNEQAMDWEAGGYSMSKEEMKRLAELGVVQSLGFGRYSVTSFGAWLLEKQFEQDARLPLRTSAEHAKREHDAWEVYCDQMKPGDTAWIDLPSDVQHQWRERAAIAAKEEKQ